MLEKRTVKKSTFELLKRLMNDEKFSDFFLVGGTSLALQLSHRKSIDLYLFTKSDIDVVSLNNHLKENYGFQQRFRAKNTLKGDINGVFIDCIKYNYPLIKPILIEENIRIASMEDVCCMKFSAITDNGTRVKDFVDIAFLSTKFSLNEMLSFYKKKYNEENLITPVKALLYFDDIDFKTEPVELFDAKFDWSKIKARIFTMTENPEKKFIHPPIEIEHTKNQTINRKHKSHDDSLSHSR